MLVRSDSRGRILLPKELRKQRLFEVQPSGDESGGILVYPMKAERIYDRSSSMTEATSQRPYSTDDAWEYIQRTMLPELVEICSKSSLNVDAVVVYGSYARGEAFNTSDLDLALFCSPLPSRKICRAFEDLVDKELGDKLSYLESKRIFTRISTVFIDSLAPIQSGSLSYSIATDGHVIFERRHSFQKWTQKVTDLMKERGVKRIQTSTEWIWKERNSG